ncbi:MAG: tetratricopeptide repeat protein [Acidobacteria bacterium]|nr:tetratricopeptide repeat protein [Acidobacteriota bacterium]MBI3426472.1 tetratricopeptide repeat protein [Acidobacteriota bacterium]
MKKSIVMLSTFTAALLLFCQPALALRFDWEKAVSLYKQGQFRAAITEFQSVLTEFPEHADSWKFIGLAYYQLKEYDPAVAPLEKALTLKRGEGKQDVDILQALGRIHVALQQYDRALPYFEALSKQQPNVAANFYMLGVIQANLNRPADSDAAFRAALKLDPKDGDTWYYLGVQQFRAGKFSDAASSLRNGLNATPKNTEMMGLLVESLLRLGANEPDERKAQTLLDEAIRVATNLKTARPDKEDAASLELLGRAFLAAKKYTNAEMTLERALAASKQPSASLFFAAGFAHAQNHAWVRAAEMLANADRLQPGDFNTLYYLGYVFENQRKFAQALDAYNRAFEASGRANADVKASIDRVAPLVRMQ